MNDEDFERCWISMFSKSLESTGENVRKRVLQGSENLSLQSSREEIIEWTKNAMERLENLVEEEKRKEILTECACEYPESQIHQLRAVYEKTHEIDAVRDVLRDQLIKDMKERKKVDDDIIKDILQKGWGIAGVRKGNVIYVTKIPSQIESFYETADEKSKRYHYYHCVRVREAIKTGITLSPTYCYCGAGFYKKIWEGILQKKVRVELLESVLLGDAVCRIAVYLPG